MHGENVEIGPLSDATIAIIEFMGIVTGPIRRGDGIALAVVLVDPKFRTTPAPPCEARPAAGCSRYGPAVTGCGSMGPSGSGYRARSGCADTRKSRSDRGDQSFDAFEDAVPVAVELPRIAESLIGFVHLGGSKRPRERALVQHRGDVGAQDGRVRGEGSGQVAVTLGVGEGQGLLQFLDRLVDRAIDRVPNPNPLRPCPGGKASGSAVSVRRARNVPGGPGGRVFR